MGVTVIRFPIEGSFLRSSKTVNARDRIRAIIWLRDFGRGDRVFSTAKVAEPC